MAERNDAPLAHDGEHDGPLAHLDPDPELSLSGIVWSSVGILGTTVVAMILMWWLSGGLVSRMEGAQVPLTPAEELAAEAARAAGEVRLESEQPDLPGLVLPADLALPPEPRLETTLTGNIERLRAREEEILDGWSWADESAGTVNVPLDAAIALAAAGELPGYAQPSAADSAASADSAADAPRPDSTVPAAPPTDPAPAGGSGLGNEEPEPGREAPDAS